MKYLLILMPIMAFGQSLNEYGLHFKTNEPAAYEVIKSHASEKWGTNYEMVVFQINKECEACYSFFQLMGEDDANQAIAYEAVMKWSYEGYDSINKRLIEEKRILEIHVNWSMVLYQYKKQLEAKGAF